MKNERLSNLEYFLESEPEDPFNWYAIAIEHKSKNIAKAQEYFEHLLTHFPNYLATYYQVAELLIDNHKKEQAEVILNKGIELAKKQNNANTLRELQNLLTNLLFDDFNS